MYARNDVRALAVPAEAGGCGSIHTRPEGLAVWDLSCVQCNAWLRKVHDPQWSATRADIPETPDEATAREMTRKGTPARLREQREESTRAALDSYAAITRLLAAAGAHETAA